MIVTQPFDVLKTRLMNAAPGQYSVINFYLNFPGHLLFSIETIKNGEIV